MPKLRASAVSSIASFLPDQLDAEIEKLVDFDPVETRFRARNG